MLLNSYLHFEEVGIAMESLDGSLIVGLCTTSKETTKKVEDPFL